MGMAYPHDRQLIEAGANDRVAITEGGETLCTTGRQWLSRHACYEFVCQLATEHCTGAYVDFGTGAPTGCGRCPTCKARAFLAESLDEEFDLPPYKTVCKACGLTGPA